MNSHIDATAFVGEYPFRGFPQTSPAALKELAQKYSVGGAAVSSFHEIFWENNFDAARKLAEEIRGDNFFTHFVVVNPKYPRQLQELPEVLETTGARGIRLLPNYHGYRLWDECALELFRFAAKRDVPVQIFREIQDARMHWMHAVAPVAAADFDWLLSALGTPEVPACRVLLSGFPFADLSRMGDVLRANENIFADLSRVRGPVFGVEKLVNEQKLERLVFGSLWPIQLVGSSTLQIDDAAISDAARKAIFSGNWQRFVGASK